MTREEAISLLTQVNHILVNSNSWLENTHEPLNIAFNMAIKALEQEPTTKNCRTCRNFGSHHGICEICKDNKCWTEKEPTIKNDVPENNVGNIYICSCGYGWDKSKVVRHHFCPNCGKAVASATKNDLGVDCISRIETIDYLCKHCPDDGECFKDCDEIKHLRQMPSVTPQPCEDAVSRQAVLDLVADYDLSMGQVVKGIHALPPVTPQEPVKKLEKQIKQLQNRCHALTHGQICVFCPYECEHKAES